MKLIFYLITILGLILTGIVIFWIIYANVKYGGYPITEVPAWTVPFIFGR